MHLMKKYFECSEFSGSQQHAKSRRRGYDGHFAELFTDNQSPDAQSTTHRFPLLPILNFCEFAALYVVFFSSHKLLRKLLFFRREYTAIQPEQEQAA